MTVEPDRDRETEKVVNLIATTLPGAYLLSGSLAVTALTAAVVLAVVASRRP
ncbi:hypothetical protein [Actinoplanes subglobosus]|uniref:Uncharacterized protein n=1 Tax=Actinoplanes subglobosus TaxID=1547892 RepID=A0ABV8J0P9_9ACTN